MHQPVLPQCHEVSPCGEIKFYFAENNFYLPYISSFTCREAVLLSSRMQFYFSREQFYFPVKQFYFLVSSFTFPWSNFTFPRVQFYFPVSSFIFLWAVLSPVYTVQTNPGSTRVSFCRVNTANPGSTRVSLSCKNY